MNIQRGVSYKERIPIFIDKEQKQDGTFYCFDGHNYGFISESRLKEFKQFNFCIWDQIPFWLFDAWPE